MRRRLLILPLLLAGCYEHHFLTDPGATTTSFDPDDADGDGLLPPGAARTLPCEGGLTPPVTTGDPPPPCDLPGDGDRDGDGFSNAIDCNDCSAQINPGAYDTPGNGVDEDCDGSDDLPCDETSGSTVAERAASALGLCQRADRDTRAWGVLSARITNANGSGPPTDPRRLSIVESLGETRPAAGDLMVALSNGQPAGATECEADDGRFESESEPAGLDVGVEGCDRESCPPSAGTECRVAIYDTIALELEVRVPTNVSAYQLASHFFTQEYPEFVCTEYNDVFVVLQGQPGALVNVIFDANGNPITVNNALLRVCAPGTHGGRYYACELGRGPLEGTGFDREPCLDDDTFVAETVTGASTGCVQTVSRVDAGETIVLRIAVWDTADAILDSLALVDGFAWLPDRFESVAP